MNILNYILSSTTKKCTHPHALINTNEGYCPDCGKYLKKYFYIIRCSSCNIKREGSISIEGIKPLTRYCPNCGGVEYYIEKHEKIDITDIRYAIHTKEEIEHPTLSETVQVWVENFEIPKMIVCNVK